MAIAPFTGQASVAGIPLAVYLAGTQAAATIYADALLTPLANPFTVDGVSGAYRFYADDSVAYDIVEMTEGQPPIPEQDFVGAFGVVAVGAGQAEATTAHATLTLVAGTGVTLTVDSAQRAITIDATGGSANPSDTVEALNGVGSPGISDEFSRGDHRHEVSVLEIGGYTGSTEQYLRADGQFATPPGNLSGPTPPVTDQAVAVWDGDTGTLLADGGSTIEEIEASAVASVLDELATVTLATAADETARFAASRQLVAGANITLNLATAGVLEIIAAGGGDGDVHGPASSVDDRITTFDGTTGKTIQDGGATISEVVAASVAAAQSAILPIDLAADVTGNLPLANIAPIPNAIGITIDGGGSVIPTGVKGFIQVPFACVITGWTLLSTDAAATVGSCVVNVWKDTYANYPPTVADKITASAPPTLSGANKATDATLTGWIVNIAAGDVIGYNVDSVATVTRVTLILAISL